MRPSQGWSAVAPFAPLLGYPKGALFIGSIFDQLRRSPSDRGLAAPAVAKDPNDCRGVTANDGALMSTHLESARLLTSPG
jgi:hypothetical protein